MTLAELTKQDLLRDLALRLRNPDEICDQMSNLSALLLSNLSPPWTPLSLFHGYPSLLLLFSTLDRVFPRENWDQTSHLYVLKTTQSIKQEGLQNLSLFKGLTGVCFAIQQASKKNARYQNILQELNSYLFKHSRKEYLAVLSDQMNANTSSPPHLYDLISGVCGVGIYALQSPDSNAFSFLKDALRICVRLGGEIQNEERKIPAWFVPYDYLNSVEKKVYPRGNFNLGIAHGVTGLLAFLSIASLHGVVVENQMDVIDKLFQWIYSKRKEENGNIFWCVRAPIEESSSPLALGKLDIVREGWCDGSAGVSRVLFLAAKALKNKILEKLAYKAFLSTFHRIEISTAFESPTLCHGFAGLLLITSLMARDTQCTELKKWSSRIEQELFKFYDPNFPFGFRDKEFLAKNQFTDNDKPFLLSNLREQVRKIPMIEVDNVGILGGVAGILLSLLHDREESLSWCYPLLIQPINNTKG